MRFELKKQANIILDWLTDLLEKGKASGEFHFTELPKAKAYLIQSSITASLQLQRIVNNDVYQIIQDSILNE